MPTAQVDMRVKNALFISRALQAELSDATGLSLQDQIFDVEAEDVLLDEYISPVSQLTPKSYLPVDLRRSRASIQRRARERKERAKKAAAAKAKANGNKATVKKGPKENVYLRKKLTYAQSLRLKTFDEKEQSEMKADLEKKNSAKQIDAMYNKLAKGDAAQQKKMKDFLARQESEEKERLRKQ